VLLTALLACAPSVPQAPDVVLVSLDTTRADALSCYGASDLTTPGLDAVAAAGTRFAWAFTAAPSTLSSHATVFTGLDPHGTRIVRNGYPLESAAETLTERLAAAGWDTIGVIGSSALQRPMGIDQGFRVWDEEFSVIRKTRHEATAKEVTDRALRHLGERQPGKPVFLFAHYYDAHSPYDAPDPYKHRWSTPGMEARFGSGQGVLKQLADQIRSRAFDPLDLAEVVDRYHGEVSYVDAEVTRLLAGLPRKETIVVLFGDHGDMFGEEPDRPFGHGADLDPAVSHVPLILRGPDVPVAVVDTSVGLQDVASTVLALVGLPALGDSRSLVPLFGGGGEDRVYFMESTQPDAPDHTGWNNRMTERGILRGGDLFLRAPWSGLEQGFHAGAAGPVSPELAPLLTAWDAKAPPWRDVDMGSGTKEALKALG
jgi:arylsulfatase A-like enzyme